MSQINWNDFSPVDGSGVSPKPAPPVGPVNWDDFSPAPEEPGLAARVKQGASRAFDSARTALTDDPNKIAQIAAEQARTALPQSDVQRKMAEEFAPYVGEANKAEGVVDNVKAWGAAGLKRAGQLVSNPGETAKMIAEQLPNSLPGMAGGIAGAKLGAMAGTAVMPGVGTAIGGLAGGVLGGFAGGYGLEKGAAMQDQVQKEAQAQRIDLRDESAVARMVALKQPEFDAAAQRKGVGTAGTDALLNVATMGLAGVGGRTLAKEARTLAQAVKAGTISAADAAADVARLQSANAARNTLGAKALRGAGVVGAEMGGEGLSEGVGQKFAYGNVDAGEVIDESLMGLGTGGAMALGSKAFNKAAGIVDQDATTQNIAAASDGLGALGPAFTTTPGAVDPNAAQAPVAQAPEAPDLSTTLGAGVPRDGVPFTRDIDTSGLAVEDRGAMERARAAMVDYEPGDATPQWETSMGAAAARQGLDMPAPEFDTGTLGLESQGRALTPSERMGINPAAGALSRAAAVAVDSGATPVQFLGATGRDLQARATGPGVTNESNVIDVQGRLVEDRAISPPRRLTDQQDGMAARAQGDRLAIQPPSAPSAVPALGGPVGADAARGGTTAVPDGVADGRPGGGSAAGNGTGAAEAGAARAGGRGNSNPALSAPTNLREGLARMRARRQEAARLAQVPPTQGANLVPQVPQAVQTIAQQQEAGNQAPVGAAATTATQPGATGGRGVQAAGVEPINIQPEGKSQPATANAEQLSISEQKDNESQPNKDAGFDSKAWDKAREDRIKASKKSGAVHLDDVTPAVESMRGKIIQSAHDPKERGVVRTVDNRGNVYVQWSDEYSGQKNLASETEEPNKSWLKSGKTLPFWKKSANGKTLVLQTSLGPSDLKDYVFSNTISQPAHHEPTPPQAIQASPQPAQAPATQGLTNAATPQNNGAQAAPATGPQGAAQAAQAGVAPRPKNWRTSMLGATPVAKAMGIDTKGKRLAQVVAEIDARDTQAPATPAPAPTPGPARLGRDNTPLSEGGKPFKTRKAAGDAKKLQPMMRVVTVPGGYALAEKTPAQLAAEERAAKRLRTPRTSPAGEPVPAHAFIAASGGLHMRHRNDLGVDGNPRIGNRRLFGGLNRGLSIEQATEMLVADGYLSEGASHNDAYALIKKSLSQPQYNADGIERIAQAESAAQFEDYMAAQEEMAQEDDGFDPFGLPPELTAEDLDAEGYTTAGPALQAEVNALVAQAEAAGIDTYDVLDDIVRTYANATQDQYNAAAREAIAAAIARSNQDGGGPAPAAAPAAPRSEPEQELNRPSALTSKAQVATESVAQTVSTTVEMPPTRQQESSPFARFATGRYRIAIRDEGNGQYAEVVAIQRGSGVEIEMRMPGEALEHPAFSQLNARAQALFETPTASMFDAEPPSLELASQTPAEAAARQDAQEQADKAESAAKRAEDAAAKAEEERKRIAQASVRAADRFELGQDPMDSLTGQGGLMFSRGTTAGMPENKAPGPQGDAQQGASTGNAVTSKWFTEDNRLSNLSQTGASWQRIRENNPVLRGKSVDDTITVYRATIGDSIRPDDYVAVDKSTLRTELKNVRERDGEAAKIVSMQVQVRDLLMGNDATEFVFFPEQKTEALGTDENTGLPLNADGTVTIYHHTSAAAATAIRRTGTLKSQAEPDVYVTTYRETDTGYGDTAVAIRIDPARLQIDDEFPNGRKDFRLNVGRPGGSIRVELENEQSAPASQGGLAFSFAGARAATADKHALVTAQDRLSAGEDAETVRQETGWHKGADGKWRFEISDADAKLKDRAQWATQRDALQAKSEAALQSKWAAQEARNAWLRQRGESPSRISSESKKDAEFKALATALKKAETTLDKARQAQEVAGRDGAGITVGSLLDHPALFAAYPGIADVRVELRDGLPANNASYTYEGRSIDLSAHSTDAQLLSTLLHEIQHGIQHIEGFATGGSIESARAMQADAQSNAFNQAQGAWYESRTRWPSAYKALMDQRMLDGRLYDKYDIKTMDEDGNQRKAIVLAFELRKKISEADKALRSQAQLAYNDAVESELGGFGSDAFNEFNGLYSAVTKAFEGTAETATSVYKRLAGEVEARNTQARHGMTDAQRRATPPNQTADVADSDVIVVFNGKEMESAPEPANAEHRLGAPLDKIRADSNARNVDTLMLVDGLKAKWTRSPEIIVARNMQDPQVPQAVRDYDAELKSQGSDGEARGFIYKGKVYLLSDELKGPEQIAEVLFHEVLGHYGLRGAFGESLTPILQQIGTMRRRDVVAKAREYGLFDKDALGGMDKKTASVAQIWAAMSSKDRISAAEEVLAEMAQTQPNIGFVQRTIAAIRNWLRTNVPGFERLRLTDADIVQAYILPARGFVTRSKETGAQSLERAMMAFSRTPGDQTQTDSFKRWFAGSRVVDADGKPLVVYHGSTSGGISNATAQNTFFTPNRDVASSYALDESASRSEGQLVVNPVYIRIENPLVVDAYGAPWMAIPFEGGRMTTDGIAAIAKQRGHDGVLIKNVEDNVNDEELPPADIYITLGKRGQIKSAIGNNGAFDSDNADIRFSRTSTATGTQSAWDAPVPTGFDDVIYKLQDKNIDLKRVVEAIAKSAGQVADSVNAYLKEELFHKRAAKRVEDFGARELKPLMNQMRLMGLGMEDVEEYLHARHAKEANAVIAQRNPGEPGLQDGGSGMTNQAADNYFAKLDPAQRRKLEAVAKNVDAIIDKTRKLYVSYGLEDQAVVDGWAGMFQHYIPLMREDKEGGMGTGQGFSVKGKETKGRTGSTRKVVDILANIASQREKLIVRGEKNQVTQALVGLAQANPNPEFWEVRSQAPTERVFDERTGTVVERPIPNFKSRDNVVVAKVQDSKGNVTEQMVVFNEDNPRAVRMAAAMKNLDAGNLEGLLGMSAKITRYFSAINTQYNPVFGVVNLVRDVQGAMVNLAATPLAGQQGKIARDTVSALAGIYSDIRKTRKGGQATSQWAQLWEQMQDDGGTTGYRELFKTSADRAENLKSILNPEGWMDSKLGRFFTADGRLKVPVGMAKKGAGFIFDWLSDYNEAMENGVRLAAYKAALDKGMSREQAASLAKNLTVNFNRKGQVGMQAGAVYAFFNAAMQGTARIGQTLFDMDGGDISTLRLSKTGKAVVYGGVTLGVMQALALAGAGFDEEDPPEFVRERSLIIPTGWTGIGPEKGYFSIPMPLGLHVIPGIGRHATEFALSGFDKPAKRAMSVIGMFADAFNPIGNAGLSMQTLAPTALDPLVALTENKDWTGKPIARVSFNKALPGHTQWKDTATWYSKMAAEAINWVSGGNEYVAGALSPTPDQIDYLVAQVGGGVAREASKVFQAASTTVNGEELPTYKIPLLGRFAGNAASQASQGTAFYANLDKLNALETEIKGLRKDGRFGEAAQLARENPQAAMIPMANRAERDVQKLRRDKRELIATGATREEVRAKEAQITAVMARLNEAAARRKATSPE